MELSSDYSLGYSSSEFEEAVTPSNVTPVVSNATPNGASTPARTGTGSVATSSSRAAPASVVAQRASTQPPQETPEPPPMPRRSETDAESGMSNSGGMPDEMDAVKKQLGFFLTDESQGTRHFIDDDTKATSGGDAGTVMGVFLPTIQNILGVILFIRLPWIVGHAGWVSTVVIILISASSTILTSLSMCAVSTNGIIASGGSYYMISRSLGPEFGGAVGVLFYLGTAVAASAYIIGFAEALIEIGATTGSAGVDIRLWGLLLLLILTVIVVIGVKYVNLAGPVFLVFVIVCCCSFTIGFFTSPTKRQPPTGVITGLLSETLADNAGFDADMGITFTFLLSLFYPSVTGFTAGSNMSGVLRNAQKSIPPATLWGVMTTSAFYLLTVILCGACVERAYLKENYFVLTEVAWPHPIIINLGILMASLGAALQCLAGAPQILQAIAADNLIPPLQFFAKLNGNNEPFRALIATSVIVVATVLPGDLNTIAPIITMFNVLCYAFINFACFLSAVLNSPGWRPSWRYYHWSVALLGLVVCITIMFIISWVSALISIVLAGAIYGYISYKNVTKDWGDGMTGLRYSFATKNLAALNHLPKGTKNWRPQLLLLCGYDELCRCENKNLLRFASQLRKGAGLVITGTVVKGDLRDDAVQGTIKSIQDKMNVLLSHKNLDGFCNVIADDTLLSGIRHLLQQAGLGMLQPNTVVFEWPKVVPMSEAKSERVASVIEDGLSLHKAIMVVKGEFPNNESEPIVGEIHLWWLFHDGGLLVLLPTLLRKHRLWKNTKLCIFAVALVTDNARRIKKELEQFLYKLRIEATVTVVEMENEEVANYSYQRTMKMKERAELEKQLKLLSGGGDIGTLESAVMTSAEEAFVQRGPDTGAGVGTTTTATDEVEASGDTKRFKLDRAEDGGMAINRGEELMFDEQHMKTAYTMNEHMKKHSHAAQLIISNLPAPMASQSAHSYTTAISALFDGLVYNRIILVRGGGVEVITMYS